MSQKLFYRLLVILVSLVFSILFILGCAQSKKQVLMILPEQSADMEYMLTNEVGVMEEMLSKAGYIVITATESGQPLVGEKTTLTPDMKIADVKVGDYLGLVLPCLARDMVKPSPEIMAIIKDAVAKGKVVAAQLGGVADLYYAGVLDGKQYAFIDDASDEFQGAIYKGDGVVVDGKIVTGAVCPYMAKSSGKKDTTAELTQKFMDVMKLP